MNANYYNPQAQRGRGFLRSRSSWLTRMAGAAQGQSDFLNLNDDTSILAGVHK